MIRLPAPVARLFPNSSYYGWTIVFVGMACSALSSPGQSFALSLYIESLITDLGISRVHISSIYAFATLSAAALLPLLGAWADRTTSRRFMAVALTGMAVALVALATAQGLVTVVIALFALRLLGQGAIGLGTLTATVRWFRRFRGRALAIVALGYAVGELVFPGLIVILQNTFGWRGSLLVIAGVYLVVAMPLVVHYMRERHVDDAPIDGSPRTPVGADTRADADANCDDRDFSFSAAIRTRSFWAMLLVVSVSPMLLTAIIFHQVALFESRGWGKAMIPSAFAMYAIMGVVITYAAGLIMERVPVRFGVSASLILAAAGLAWFAWGAAGAWAALVYGALLGMSSAVAGAANSLIWPDYFGIRVLGALKGVVNAVRNGATAVGPVIIAVLAANGGFGRGLLVLGVIAVAGAVIALFILPPPFTADAGARGDGVAQAA